ncbi:4'-phosphopantetheinyl transferase [gamma proteobacterium IMCC1989]|nr:4'-phosphopantetheinyl transferase [gamma proteobacterium IMCC1989]
MMINTVEKSVPAIYVANKNDFSIDRLVCLLGDEERVRLDRFRQHPDKERHALAHSLKRAVLSQYIPSAPHELNFFQSAYGKPFCSHPDSPFFNLSHSGDWVVLAVSTENEIGVDVEFERAINMESIVQRISSAREIDIYQRSGCPQQCFLCLWTQKEAVSKANGQGISVGLSSIPCSGELGVHSVSFQGVSYVSYSYLFDESGVLSYVSTAGTEPKIVRVTSMPDESVSSSLVTSVFAL